MSETPVQQHEEIWIRKAQAGVHNDNTKDSVKRTLAGRRYEDLKTVWITPMIKGEHPIEVCASWYTMQRDPNHRMHRNIVVGLHIDDAYNMFIERAIDPYPGDPDVRNYSYILTSESDNIIPADGLMKLFSSINGGVDGIRYDAVGGLYWQKTEDGAPLIFGDPSNLEDFAVQVPRDGEVQECNGMGMGFTLFRMELFRDPALYVVEPCNHEPKCPRDTHKQWFRTIIHTDEDGNRVTSGQDSTFFLTARHAGKRLAVDTRVKVGHLDVASGKVY